jgi:hypothetical protein
MRVDIAGESATACTSSWTESRRTDPLNRRSWWFGRAIGNGSVPSPAWMSGWWTVTRSLGSRMSSKMAGTCCQGDGTARTQHQHLGTFSRLGLTGEAARRMDKNAITTHLDRKVARMVSQRHNVPSDGKSEWVGTDQVSASN